LSDGASARHWSARPSLVVVSDGASAWRWSARPSLVVVSDVASAWRWSARVVLAGALKHGEIRVMPFRYKCGINPAARIVPAARGDHGAPPCVAPNPEMPRSEYRP
jgi:hypothetical protein